MEGKRNIMVGDSFSIEGINVKKPHGGWNSRLEIGDVHSLLFSLRSVIKKRSPVCSFIRSFRSQNSIVHSSQNII